MTVEANAPDIGDVEVGELDVAQLRVLADRGDADAQTELGQRYEEAAVPDAPPAARRRSGGARVAHPGTTTTHTAAGPRRPVRRGPCRRDEFRPTNRETS